MEAWLYSLLHALALPQFGLSTVFVVAFVSATLLPMGSEPAVFGLIKLNPELFWPAILVATVGNTLGGALNWWLGYGAHQAFDRITHKEHPVKARALVWLRDFVLYMAIGKFLRYLAMTSALLWFFPGMVELPR
jgi:membrane protein YqaA with SNARE-associated domain